MQQLDELSGPELLECPICSRMVDYGLSHVHSHDDGVIVVVPNYAVRFTSKPDACFNPYVAGHRHRLTLVDRESTRDGVRMSAASRP